MTTSLSIARALTTKRKDDKITMNISAPIISRAASQRVTSISNVKPINRSEISLPVALLSTTNMLSYEAPDIVNAPCATANRTMSVNRTTRSPSDASSSASTNSSTRSRSSSQLHASDTDMTDLSDTSPIFNKESDYLDKFFKSSTSSSTSQRSTQSTFSSQVNSSPIINNHPSPVIPSRSSSRSEKSSRPSAQYRALPKLETISSQPEARNSAEMFNSDTYDNVTKRNDSMLEHPFANELKALNQVAQSFRFSSPNNPDSLADYNVMQSRNLSQHCVVDYLMELSELRGPFADLDNNNQQSPSAWI